MSIIVKNMQVYRFLRAFVSIAESLVAIVTLGFVAPGWSLDLGEWRLRRNMTAYRARKG